MSFYLNDFQLCLGRKDHEIAFQNPIRFDFDMLTTQHPMSLEPSSSLKQYFGSESSDVSVFNSAGISNPAIDALIDYVINAENKAELKTSVKGNWVFKKKISAFYKGKHTLD